MLGVVISRPRPCPFLRGQSEGKRGYWQLPYWKTITPSVPSIVAVVEATILVRVAVEVA